MDLSYLKNVYKRLPLVIMLLDFVDDLSTGCTVNCHRISHKVIGLILLEGFIKLLFTDFLELSISGTACQSAKTENESKDEKTAFKVHSICFVEEDCVVLEVGWPLGVPVFAVLCLC